MEKTYIQTKIFEAIAKNDFPEVCNFLNRGVNVNAIIDTVSGETVLHKAARNGCTELLKPLLYSGANINSKDNENLTPLQYALCGNHINTAIILIQAGADVNDVSSNFYGQSALHFASETCDVQLIEFLLNYHADVNVKNYKSQTPLHVAADNCTGDSHHEVMKILLINGTDVDAQDFQGQTVLHTAIRRHGISIKIVELLLEFKADVNIRDNNGDIPLTEAILTENFEVVQLLVDHGSNVYSINNKGLIPFCEAIKIKEYSSSKRIIEIFLKKMSEDNPQKKNEPINQDTELR